MMMTSPLLFEKHEIACSIPERFGRVVRHFPDKPAVVSEDQRISYAELDATSNRVANAILARRGQDEDQIALLMPSSADSIAAILGILKTGKTYLALDPYSPPSRLKQTLNESQAAILITDDIHKAENLKRMDDDLQLVGFEHLVSSSPDHQVDLEIPPHTLAALFFTSGTTGKPKGIPRTHEQVLHYSWSNRRNYQIQPDDCQSLLLSLGFSSSTSDIFHTLLNGASLHPFPSRIESPQRLKEWLDRGEITLFHPPVSLFRQLIDVCEEDHIFSKVRLVVFAGQAVYKSDVQKFKRHFPPQAVLVNRLGSGEVGAVAQFSIQRDTEIDGETVPVGYAVEDKEVLILDGQGKELEFGQVGEVAVRSRYLAPGYWRDPELTRQKFLPDPEGGEQRIYLSGDLGRKLHDGRLELLGRVDSQVKVRGFRVELSTVEGVLQELGSVKEAAVVSRLDRFGESHLVAYLVLASGEEPSVSQIRDGISARLPEYMIPAKFVILPELPLTSTGKVDRRALPEPIMGRPELGSPYQAPGTPIEMILSEIWSEVLDIERVGVNDNFFELGGNSLHAARIVSAAAAHFQLNFPVSIVMEKSTIAELAKIVAGKIKPSIKAELTNLISEVEGLTDQEIQRILSDKNKGNERLF